MLRNFMTLKKDMLKKKKKKKIIISLCGALAQFYRPTYKGIFWRVRVQQWSLAGCPLGFNHQEICHRRTAQDDRPGSERTSHNAMRVATHRN